MADKLLMSRAQKKALITGVCGQDGVLLSQSLNLAGYDVYGVAKSGATGMPPPNVCMAGVDLANDDEVLSAISDIRPDEIYHLAAHHHSTEQTSLYTSMQAYEQMLSTNVQATKNLAFAILKAGLHSHLIFAASSQMYTPASPEDCVNELRARQPATFYGYTKRWGLDLLFCLRAKLGLRCSTAILFNHESPLRSMNYVTRKITRAAALTKAGRSDTLRLMNIGARVDWSSAKDVVEALRIMAGQEKGNEYVVASGRLRSIKDVLDTAFGSVGLHWRDYVEFERDEPTFSLKGDPSEIERLGWRRRISFQEMIEEMVQYDLATATTPPPSKNT